MPARKVEELRELLVDWPVGRSTATVREVLVLTGKLHHAAYVIRPGRNFVRWLLQLSRLHQNGQERRGGAWRRGRNKAEAGRVLRPTKGSWKTWNGGDGA